MNLATLFIYFNNRIDSCITYTNTITIVDPKPFLDLKATIWRWCKVNTTFSRVIGPNEKQLQPLQFNKRRLALPYGPRELFSLKHLGSEFTSGICPFHASICQHEDGICLLSTKTLIFLKSLSFLFWLILVSTNPRIS